MEIFCNIMNVFTVTLDQFNASLLNKSINFLKKKKKSDTRLLIGGVHTVENDFFFCLVSSNKYKYLMYF